jgi:hypothetical protein
MTGESPAHQERPYSDEERIQREAEGERSDTGQQHIAHH